MIPDIECENYPYDEEYGFLKDAMVWTPELPIVGEPADRYDTVWWARHE